jgi:ABC-type nickel/cobalt efflux system permease component RcnA
MQILGGWILGLVLGMRHALEPDHLAAISTLVTETRSPRRGALVGAFWGAGHTLALLAAGAVLAGLQSRMPDRIAESFELLVALMLILLGARALVRAARAGGPAAAHTHGHLAHVHAGPEDHVHVGRWTLARRPLLVGLVHGLAGSGALTALVLASLSGLAARLVYIALFGFGSVFGMALLSGLAGWPLSRMGRDPRAARVVAAVAGALSMGCGAFFGWEHGLRLFAAG